MDFLCDWRWSNMFCVLMCTKILDVVMYVRFFARWDHLFDESVEPFSCRNYSVSSLIQVAKKQTFEIPKTSGSHMWLHFIEFQFWTIYLHSETRAIEKKVNLIGMCLYQLKCYIIIGEIFLLALPIQWFITSLTIVNSQMKYWNDYKRNSMRWKRRKSK